jgi:septum formation protein
MKPALPPIILASKSPRRHELLKQVGLPFRVIVREGLETYPDELQGAEIAAYLCGQKADAFEDLCESSLILTADTIVWQKHQILGKPADRQDALKILNQLAGNSHEVFTGVCLYHKGHKIVFTERTEVVFNAISRERLEWYVDHFSVMDKAGAYGVQDWIGLAGVKAIHGDFYNVMGLPVNRLVRELEQQFVVNFETP